ncbi:unnamed protein product [Cuscuta campestris]|uniref:3-ketoacyl-CoA synthase n=1 Tax=Cuscuta campestris TaxID=132261 RepID=A0A484M710_9ASTE|nr:unnamed protein product [Cuscuta campestris]
MTPREEQCFSTEIVNRGIELSGPDAGVLTFSVKVRRRLPDFVQSVKLKYVKLGYYYLINNGLCVAAVMPLLAAAVLGLELVWDCKGRRPDLYLAVVVPLLALLGLSLSLFYMSKPTPIYLVDFACSKPNDNLKVTKDEFIDIARKTGTFNDESLDYMRRLLENSGIGDETYVPKSIGYPEKDRASLKVAREEASAVMFDAIDELLEKTSVRAKEIGVLVVNCGVFNPTPSISAMVINRYKMRDDILSWNLGGMGCSAGIIALDLARDILRANPRSCRFALLVSTEVVGSTWYSGNDPSMLIPNCFFRTGCSAVLLSNRCRDSRRSKYRLEHIVRTHHGSNDQAFRSIYQDEDGEGRKGLRINRELMRVGGEALKENITTLGPMVLPLTEQFLFFKTLLRRVVTGEKTRPYIPNYEGALTHLCASAASERLLEELRRNLKLGEERMEASRATLDRFGNTSSSSIWYEVAYLEAKGRVKAGNRVWQLAFGSGFKCNSAVWVALRQITKPHSHNPWLN